MNKTYDKTDYFFRYHDMQNVVDFFILKQVYDQSLQRDWRPGRFARLHEKRMSKSHPEVQLKE